jgi:hypothetical protein
VQSLPENEQEKIALLIIEKLNEQKDNQTVDKVINLPEKQVWDNPEDEVYDNL